MLRLPPRSTWLCTLAAILCTSLLSVAQQPPAGPTPPDVLVLKNGDTLHGKFVSETGGKVNFHSDPLGDLSISWDNIRELHTQGSFAVLDKTMKAHRNQALNVPEGKLAIANNMITVEPQNQARIQAPAPIPTETATFIVDQQTLNKEVNRNPGFLAGWNGSATAGATLVKATENQYTVSGAVSLMRTVPTVSWLDPRNRTQFDFTESYGKITQPAYLDAGALVPATYTKTAITHVDAERDEYFSVRYYGLAQTSFDHNYSQNLGLQQIYGAGIGWTALKDPKQEADLKATIQYEKQSFIASSAGENQNLIGSTISAYYIRKMKLLVFNQSLAFVPAFNDPKAYSANETDTMAFPAWKNLSFSVGTIDSYLNFVPPTLPPTKRNSFQFTMGLTYAFKSKY